MGRKKSMWISVERRLPEKSHERYLVYTELGIVDFDIYSAIGGWQGYNYVTHWMPLPEPPPQPKPPQYKRLKDEHRCVRCKEPLPEEYTGIRCPECMEKYRAYVKEHYKGKCRICSRELPPDYKYLICKKCRIKRSQERYEKKQRKEDEGK